MLIDIPYIHCFVAARFILEDKHLDPVACYIYSATAIKNRPLLFNIHTIHGALYSRLPIHAFSFRKSVENPLPKEEVDPWGVIGDKFQVIEHAYLKGYQPTLLKHPQINSVYRMSFDWHQGGFSEDPQQSKTMHLLELGNGQLGLFPNNELLFRDNHFTSEDPMPKYKRNNTYYLANG